jgi:hypothetical protein
MHDIDIEAIYVCSATPRDTIYKEDLHCFSYSLDYPELLSSFSCTCLLFLAFVKSTLSLVNFTSLG